MPCLNSAHIYCKRYCLTSGVGYFIKHELILLLSCEIPDFKLLCDENLQSTSHLHTYLHHKIDKNLI